MCGDVKFDGKESGVKKLDLTVIGDINLDMLVEVPRFPVLDDEVQITSRKHSSGGDAVNICSAAARLGLSPALIACAGDDPEGRTSINELKRMGVNTEAVLWDAHTPTGYAVAMVRPDGQRNLLTYRGANQNLHLEEKQQTLLARSRMVHLSDPLPHIVQEAAAVLSLKTWVSLDPGSITAERGLEPLIPLLQKVRIFFSNEHEICQLTELTSWEKAARKLHELGPQIVVIKRGAQGCKVITQDVCLDVPGFSVQAIDTTGAGDAFDAGFLTAYLEQQPLVEAARFANAVGALTTRAVGAQESQPTRQEVVQLIQSN